MGKKTTRKKLQAEIVEQLLFLLDMSESIPLSEKMIDVGEFGEATEKYISKGNEDFFLYVLNKKKKNEYEGEKIQKDQAVELLKKQFNPLTKVQLTEELNYWKEYATTFKSNYHTVVSPEQFQLAMEKFEGSESNTKI